MKISKAVYKDAAAIKAETEKVEVLFLPELGGKCASIKDKKSGREFLSQDPGDKYRRLAYDGDYCAAECCGFDDMFPTIDRYYYDRYPWNGIAVPDHGEVCGLEWKHNAQNGVLHMWTHSPRFGYKFEKKIFESNEGFLIEYRVTNNTQFTLDFIYAAHCMVAAEKNGMLLLPGVPEGEKAAMVFSSDVKRGRYGSPLTWSNNAKDMIVTPDQTTVESFKFFFDAPRREGCCAYRYPDGICISMKYSSDKLPYLGIWINRYDFHGLNNVAFEPASGSFDRPDVARTRGQFSTLKPYAEYEWNIAFDVRSGDC
jgi:hypothetical protein